MEKNRGDTPSATLKGVKDWFMAIIFCDYEVLMQIALLSHLQIKVGLQNTLYIH